MSSVSGFRGVYALDWAQTAPGEEWGLPPEFLSIGMSWRWQGVARRLDAGVSALWLDAPHDRSDRRGRVRRRMRRLALADVPEVARDGADEPVPPGDSMVLTDGRRLYPARIVRQGGGVLAVFHPLLPPPGRELHITALDLAPAGAGRRGGVICFLPGTRIATPAGPRAVEALEPGMLVSTRDNGAQPLVWRGETRLSGAELYLYPHLRPLRIARGALDGVPDADLFVSPGHRLLRRAPGCLGGAEVLVAAEDLEDGRVVRRDFSLGAVRYVHLLLERHEILTANGLPCESFHPALAGPRVLQWHARSLEKAVPGLAADPARYGEPVRRCLGRGEAAILRAALV